MKDDDEDDGWGDADEQDEYENKQFDNIEDDSFKIRIACVKLIKELLLKLTPVNKEVSKFGKDMADKIADRCNDNIGEVQAATFENLYELTGASSSNLINWDISIFHITQLFDRKDAGKKEVSKGLDLISHIIQKNLISKPSEIKIQHMVNLCHQSSQSDETKYQVMYFLHNFKSAYPAESKFLLRPQSDFLID